MGARKCLFKNRKILSEKNRDTVKNGYFLSLNPALVGGNGKVISDHLNLLHPA